MEGSEAPGIQGGGPDPRARLMQEVAQQMDAIEADYPNGFGIGRVLTIVEVVDAEGSPELRVRANMLPWVALGMLKFAEKYITATPQSDE